MGKNIMVEFNIISLNTALFGTQFNAKNNIGSTIYNSPQNFSNNKGPAVVTPWATPDTNPLLSRYNKIRNKNTFINENTPAVRKAGFNKDDKALFTLYSALNDLKTIAQYAADKSSPANLLASLSSQFSSGINQVDTYVRQSQLDKLTLLYGEKKSYVTSSVALGKNNNDIQSGRISALTATSPILGITGTEVFTININAGGTVQNNVVIDLSTIAVPITLTSLKDHINSQIAAFTTVNGAGSTVGTYATRVKINEITPGKFGFTFAVAGVEKLTFSAAASAPSLIIAGTTQSSDLGSVATGTLSKYTNLTGTGVSTSFSLEIAGIDENGFVIPAPTTDPATTTTTSTSTAQVFETTPQATKVDSQGNVLVVGTTTGDLNGQINGATTSDVFLSKYSSTGELLWSRLLGASDVATGYALALDSQDNVIIGGKVNGELIASDVFTGTDSFVSKFSSTGQELWTKQLDTIATDQVNNLTVDANDDIYFTGQVTGRFDVTTIDNGGLDATIVKITGATGAVAATTQFGSALDDVGSQIAIASDGNILALALEGGNAVIRKLDKNNLSTTLATYDIGSLAGGTVTGISVVGTDIYVSGSSQNGTLNGGTVNSAYSGGNDGFVTKLTDAGTSFTAAWTTFIGTASTDKIDGITVQGGAIYVAGTTGGTLTGGTRTGLSDGFTAKIDAVTGATLWQEQLKGTSGYNKSTSIAFSANGSSILDQLGLPTGTVNNTQTRDIETQTSARVGDYFYISIDNRRNIKIDIRAGDTFATLAKRIDNLSINSIKGSVTYGADGPQLKIEATNGAPIKLSAGKVGSDALHKLGLKESSIIASNKLFNLNASANIDPTKLGGIFALGLNTGFSFGTKAEAAYIVTQLDNAIRNVQSAHRSLTFDPLRAEILAKAKKNYGPAPAYLQDRLARYQEGLKRVLAVTGGSII